MKEIKDLGAIQDNRFLGNSTNTKELYIVVTNEPSVSISKNGKSVKQIDQTTYLGIRADESAATVKMSGYDVTHYENISKAAQSKDASYNDIIDSVKGVDLEFQVLTFPWQRIIRIKQLKLTLAKQSA